MRNMRALTLLAATAICAAAPARAQFEVCEEGSAMPIGPVQAGVYEGKLGVARRICARSELAADAAALAVIEPKEFYGHLRAAGVISGSWALSTGTELFGSLEALRYETVISSVQAGYTGLGDTSLGITQRLGGQKRWRVGVTSRLVLPTTTGLYEHARPFGLDLGLGASWLAAGRVAVHGQLGALGSVALSRGDSQPRLGAMLVAGLEYQPWRWFAAVLDGEAGMGYAATLDLIAIGPALRFAPWSRIGIELSGLMPIAGRERALAAALLRVSWRF